MVLVTHLQVSSVSLSPMQNECPETVQKDLITIALSNKTRCLEKEKKKK